MVYSYAPNEERNIPALECSLEDLEYITPGRVALNCLSQVNELGAAFNNLFINVVLCANKEKDAVEVRFTYENVPPETVATIPTKEFFDKFVDETRVSDAGNICNNKYIYNLVEEHIDDFKQKLIHHKHYLLDNVKSTQIVLFSSNNIPVESLTGTIRINAVDSYIDIDNQGVRNKDIIKNNGYLIVCPDNNQEDAYILRDLKSVSPEYMPEADEDELDKEFKRHSITFNRENWKIISRDEFIRLNGGEPVNETVGCSGLDENYEIEW